MTEIVPSESAVLVHIQFRDKEHSEDLGEFIDLVHSSGITPASIITASRHVPDPCFFIGRGKVDEIRERLLSDNVKLIIFNNAISPSQERNLEKELKCRVIDRVGLILDIFALRARSYEGKLQVELAQLQHLSTRLIRGWTHLERQKGGIGLRGPGETQLETDRRLIFKRIKSLNSKLDKVRIQRQQGVKQRRRADVPVISLVGYTNVGKSTLFNCMTGAEVYSADKLFATLDPIVRRAKISPELTVILTDTVGFIRHIPHGLIEAFNATLEETREADLLIHVVDINDEYRHEHIDQVNRVIEEIGAGNVPQILVYNKIDQLELEPGIEKNSRDEIHRVWLSATENEGIELLKNAIKQRISTIVTRHTVHLPASAGKLRARLFDIGVVYKERESRKGGWILEINIDTHYLSKLCRESGLEAANLQ